MYIITGLETGLLDCLHHEIQGIPGTAQIGGETALVTDIRVVPGLR